MINPDKIQKQIAGVTVECVQGDIASQDDMQAVVNAANKHLAPGGGVAGALHRAAGPKLAKAGRTFAPIAVGECVITPAFNLPNEYVLHCLGPRYGINEPADQLLADCFDNALRLADEHEITSLAFPAISTGAFGYPTEEAATVSLQQVAATLPELQHIETVRFVLYTQADLEIYANALVAL
ncbi:MAG: macro domain-containing protein [Candidatus Paceibacterota bacterium]